jgi:hypothetical protein
VVHGVIVEIIPPPVVTFGCPRIGVTCGILDLMQWRTTGQGQGDENVPKAVWRDPRFAHPAADDIPDTVGSDTGAAPSHVACFGTTASLADLEEERRLLVCYPNGCDPFLD